MNENVNFYQIIDKFLDKTIDINSFETINFDKNISTSLLNQFKKKCSIYVYKILHAEYNNFKKLKDLRPQQALKEFYNYLDHTEYIDTLIMNFPIMNKLIHIESENFTFFTNELYKNLEFHKKTVGFNEIKSIDIGFGDSHDNGKMVCKLKIDNRIYFYKPRNARMDKKFNELVQKFIPDYSATIFSYNNFSIHEDIPHISNLSLKKDVKSYYFNLGLISSILYFLTSTDMHYENIIVSHKNPIFIDLETLSDNTENIILKKNPFNSLYSNSIFQSMIFPLQTSNKSLDISALTGRYSTNENFFYTNESIHLNSIGEIIIKNEPITMANQKNEIFLNNIKQEPINYINEIVNGFSQFANEVLKNPKKTSANLLDILKYSKIRQVIRPTHVYEKYLQASIDPYYLKSKTNYKGVFNNIKNLFNPEIYKSEINSLSNRDVPLFYTTWDSQNLYCNDNLVSKNFFTKTIKESISERIENFSEQKHIYEINNIINSLFVYYNNNSHLNVQNSSIVKGYGDKYEFQKYMDMYTNENSALAPYFDGEKFNISILTPSLFDYGGLLILEALKDEKKVKIDVFKKIILTMEDCKSFDSTFVSGFNGFGGFLYLLTNLYNIYKDDWFYNKLILYINNLHKKGIQNLNIPKLDYFTGIAGFMTILLNVHPFLKDRTIIKNNQLLLNDLNDFITENYKDLYDTTTKIGLAHGYSGLVIPLSLYNKLFKTKKNTSLINILLKIEEEFYNENSNNYYDLRDNNDDKYYICYGIIGILLSRLELLRNGVTIDINSFEKKVNLLLQNLSELRFQSDFSYCLCHGFASIIEFLVELRKFYSNDLINPLIDKYIQAVNNTYYNGLKNTISFNGFFLGESGVEYVLLKEKHNLPSIVLLKIF